MPPHALPRPLSLTRRPVRVPAAHWSVYANNLANDQVQSSTVFFACLAVFVILVDRYAHMTVSRPRPRRRPEPSRADANVASPHPKPHPTPLPPRRCRSSSRSCSTRCTRWRCSASSRWASPSARTATGRTTASARSSSPSRSSTASSPRYRSATGALLRPRPGRPSGTRPDGLVLAHRP